MKIHTLPSGAHTFHVGHNLCLYDVAMFIITKSWHHMFHHIVFWTYCFTCLAITLIQVLEDLSYTCGRKIHPSCMYYFHLVFI